MVKSRTDLPAQKLPYAHEHAPVGDFLDAIKALKPTAIIGVAAVGGTFTQEVLEEMARHQRAADRVCAVQPDVESRVHAPSRLTDTPTGARCSPAAARSTP